MKDELISIIVPVFNAENTLLELFERTKNVFEKSNYRFEMILVDDGSKDGSWKVLEKLHSENKNILAIKLTKNFGQHSAILSGLTHSKGGLIITMDDDLQHPPEEITKLIDAFEKSGSDVIYGISESTQQSALKKVGSKSVTLTSEYSAHQGSSFRLIKKNIIDKIVLHHQYNFLYLDALLNWYTSDFTSVRVEHHPRKTGKSGYSFFKLFLLYFKMTVNFSVVPLRILTFGAIFFSLLCFIVGAYFIAKKLFYDVPLGYTSLIVTILFSTSMIVSALGFIGLYIHKIFEFNLQKPTYFITKILDKKDDH